MIFENGPGARMGVSRCRTMCLNWPLHQAERRILKGAVRIAHWLKFHGLFQSTQIYALLETDSPGRNSRAYFGPLGFIVRSLAYAEFYWTVRYSPADVPCQIKIGRSARLHALLY